jgi:hypothetical protein
MSGIYKFLEFLIRCRKSINIEVTDHHGMLMKATRNIFPGIGDVDSGLVAALDLYPFYDEVKFCR